MGNRTPSYVAMSEYISTTSLKSNLVPGTTTSKAQAPRHSDSTVSNLSCLHVRSLYIHIYAIHVIKYKGYFFSTLVITAQVWKELSPLKGEWVHELWHTHTRGPYAAVKKNKAALYALL